MTPPGDQVKGEVRSAEGGGTKVFPKGAATSVVEYPDGSRELVFDKAKADQLHRAAQIAFAGLMGDVRRIRSVETTGGEQVGVAMWEPISPEAIARLAYDYAEALLREGERRL